MHNVTDDEVQDALTTVLFVIYYKRNQLRQWDSIAPSQNNAIHALSITARTYDSF